MKNYTFKVYMKIREARYWINRKDTYKYCVLNQMINEDSRCSICFHQGINKGINNYCINRIRYLLDILE